MVRFMVGHTTRAGALAALLSIFVVMPTARGQGLDETCSLALTAFDPAVINVAYPDDSAKYYSGAYSVLPGTRVRITGVYPHARYMSFNVYDPQLRPVDGISDVRIGPDPGSANPFDKGADRTTTTGRDYTVFIEPGAKPADPPPNTLYANGQVGTFIYRIYIPDKGADDYGGTGLPTAQIEPATATARPAASPCAGVAKPTVHGINEALAAVSPPADAPTGQASDPPVWRKFVNLLSSVAINVTGSPDPGGLDLDSAGGSGGFLSNKDNAYVSAPINRKNGRILVTRFLAPTFPNTRPPAGTMPGGQLRYWSVCQNDPPTQRFIACVNDDRSVLTDDGYVRIVTSTTADRPPTATEVCGVNWIPWGADAQGVLIYRNMLPDPAFTQSIQGAKVDHEAETMGEYLPVSTYYPDAAAYAAAIGCRHAVPAGDFVAAAPPVTARRCAHRRRVVITLPRRARVARRVRVRIAHRHARRVRVQRHRYIVVKVPGRAGERVRVRVRRHGHVVRTRRVRVCR
jgi:hypothetical protein